MGRPAQIQMDCADPEALAAFWAEVLEYRVATPGMGHATWGDWSEAEAREPGERWCRVVDPDGQGISILFHRVPEPKTVKNRLHLDVWVAPRGGDRETNWPTVDAEVKRLVALGATEIRRVSEDDQCFVVMSDPEGNEFCACG
jgi:catechol 2,3-dioxygenase-like lactoylglutathione lyase family enzyme